jgi:hypothetical protein
MRHVQVIGRRWFDGTNTYFSATVELDGEEVVNIPFEYGYGGHYRYRALAKLHAERPELFREDPLGPLAFGYRSLQPADNVRICHTVSNVKRKRDL